MKGVQSFFKLPNPSLCLTGGHSFRRAIRLHQAATSLLGSGARAALGSPMKLGGLGDKNRQVVATFLSALSLTHSSSL